MTQRLPIESAAAGAHLHSDHTPSGFVQPHGLLLVVDRDLRVGVCSANSERLVGVAESEVLGRPLAALVGTDLAARVAARLEDPDGLEAIVAVLSPVAGTPGATGAPAGELTGRPVDVRVHDSGHCVLVELETASLREPVPDADREVRAAITRLTAARTLGQLTDLLARELRRLTGFDRVTVLRYDAAWEADVLAEARRDDLVPHLGRHVATDLSAAGAGLGARSQPTPAPTHAVVDERAAPVPLVPESAGAAIDLSRASLRLAPPRGSDHLDADGVDASLTLTISIDDQPWGLVVAHHHSGPHRLGHDVRSSVEFFTDVASHLVAHRVRAEARESAARTRAELTAYAARLTASREEVLDAVFADDGLLAVFGATGAANLFEGELRVRGTVPDLATMQEISDLLNLPDSYASTTDRLVALDEKFAAIADVAGGVLRVGTLSERWGLWFRTDGRRWEPWHIEAAEELGRHVNSLLLLRSREQVAMAESMQRSVVLDSAPVFDGVEMIARYRPATTYQLGGDWWDAFELDGRRLAVVVGDVAGHGVVAASAMTQVRTAMRAYLYDSVGAASALDRLDRLMDGLLGLGVATALVAILDRETGRVELSSAGHPDPILVAPDGTAREVSLERRPLLGVGCGQAPTSYVDLSDGSLLVVFTDGLVERRGVDTDAQTARLLDLAAGGLAPRPHDDPGRWADLLLAELDSADDDTTLLALRTR